MCRSLRLHITTSGHFRTQAPIDVMREVSPDRILYSVDFPFEDMSIAAEWFGHVPLNEADRLRIGRGNARQLFRLE